MAGAVMAPCTVTFAVVSAMVGSLLAWITVAPEPTIVSGTATVVLPGAKLTVAGTVATVALLEKRSTASPPAGAWPESVSVMFCVPPPVRVTFAGVKATVAVTWTATFAEL